MELKPTRTAAGHCMVRARSVPHESRTEPGGRSPSYQDVHTVRAYGIRPLSGGFQAVLLFLSRAIHRRSDAIPVIVAPTGSPAILSLALEPTAALFTSDYDPEYRGFGRNIKSWGYWLHGCESQSRTPGSIQGAVAPTGRASVFAQPGARANIMQTPRGNRMQIDTMNSEMQVVESGAYRRVQTVRPR